VISLYSSKVTREDTFKIYKMTDDYLDIALFPIPGMVCFPYCSTPLHVFEPRYRRLVDEALERNMLVGMCNTVKKISTAKTTESLEDALQTNQSTYEPAKIFGAGYVNIDCIYRAKSELEIQTLPYTIMRCKEVVDTHVTDENTTLELQSKIIDVVSQMVSTKYPKQKSKFDIKKWSSLHYNVFAFKIFQILKLDPRIMQSLLETTNPQQRLLKVYSYLTKTVS
jgi:Lon protease-like protein